MPSAFKPSLKFLKADIKMADENNNSLIRIQYLTSIILKIPSIINIKDKNSKKLYNFVSLFINYHYL